MRCATTRSAGSGGLPGPTLNSHEPSYRQGETIPEISTQKIFFPLVPQGHGTENAMGAFTKLQIRGILIIERHIEGGLEGSQGLNWAECMPA